MLYAVAFVVQVFQRRMNDQTDFDKNWNNYKNGFGNPESNFWWGT